MSAPSAATSPPSASTPSAAVTPPKATRVISLDALRGITVAVMLLVNNPGSWSHIYPPLEHAEWNGCTLADLVFPFFLFTVGASMAISFERSRSKGASREQILLHALRRAAVLILLGMGLNALSLIMPRVFGTTAPAWETFRWLGVLQRIGLVFAASSIIVLYAPRTLQVCIGAAVLAGYAGLIGAHPVREASNPAAAFDAIFIPLSHMYKGGPLDPEGLLSTFPAIVSSLLGYWLSQRLQSHPRPGSVFARFLASGLVIGAAGFAAAFITPINKALWTSSYVLVTGGAAILCWAMLHELIDVRSFKRAAFPAVVFGSNAIFAFVASGVVGRLLGTLPVSRSPEGNVVALNRWVYEHIFLSFATPVNASLAFALTTVVCWYAVHHLLYRRGIFFKV